MLDTALGQGGGTARLRPANAAPYRQSGRPGRQCRATVSWIATATRLCPAEKLSRLRTTCIGHFGRNLEPGLDYERYLMADTSTKKFSRQTLQPWSWDRARRGIFSMPQIFGSA